MSSLWPFILGVITLLAVPGPTNSLMAAAGARTYFAHAPKLVAAEVSAYLFAIHALMQWGAPIVEAFPRVGALLQLAVALYLVRSATWFWQHGGNLCEDMGEVTAARVFLTTLGNPKSAIFAFLIFPAVPTPYTFGLFAPISAAMALAWMMIGALIVSPSSSPATPRLVYKGAAGIHMIFALMMARAAWSAVA